MTVDAWLECARDDARRHSREDLVPVLETLARAATIVRAAAWNRAVDEDADEDAPIAKP